jgi:hypothetical protein
MLLSAAMLPSVTAFSPQLSFDSASAMRKMQLFASTLDKGDTSTGSASSSSAPPTGTQLLRDRLASSSVASAAALATAAVNAAVAMKTLEAPDVQKSYVTLSKSPAEIDKEGLPLTYDKEAIEAYWSKERGALNQRWGQFVGKAVPFFTRVVTLFIRDGKVLDSEIPTLSKQARLDLQDLGPTFIKVRMCVCWRRQSSIVNASRRHMRNYPWYITNQFFLLCRDNRWDK